MRLARLKTYWEAKGFRNAKEFAAHLEISASHFSELDKRENPSRLLLALTRTTDINIEWLLTGQGSMIDTATAKAPAVEEESPRYRPAKPANVPVISVDDAGNSSDLPERVVPPSDVADTSAYGVRVTGTAMARMYDPGCLLIVSPEKMFRDGMAAVATLADGRKLVRIIRKKKGLIILEAVNPAFETVIHHVKEVESLHPVVWKREPD